MNARYWYFPPGSGTSARAKLPAPASPESLRRETAWVYSQGAPPTFKGDLYYYSVDHDLSQTAEEIDTSIVAVYILCGEYDYSGVAGFRLARDLP